MLKIVVFDSGLSGEIFAERLAAELPVVEIIRVIAWPDVSGSPVKSKDMRSLAESALAPYIGKVDLIIFANYLLSTTSLNYFRRKYQRQKFIGFPLETRRLVFKKSTLILTTKATTRSFAYFAFAHRIRARTVCLDDWPNLTSGEALTPFTLKQDLGAALARVSNFSPEQVLLFCGCFTDFMPELHEVFGHNVRIVDSFDETIYNACRILRIRGGTGKKRK